MHLKSPYTAGNCYKYKHYNIKELLLSRSNLSNQIFKASAPNKVWLGNMTDITPKKERYQASLHKIGAYYRTKRTHFALDHKSPMDFDIYNS